MCAQHEQVCLMPLDRFEHSLDRMANLYFEAQPAVEPLCKIAPRRSRIGGELPSNTSRAAGERRLEVADHQRFKEVNGVKGSAETISQSPGLREGSPAPFREIDPHHY